MSLRASTLFPVLIPALGLVLAFTPIHTLAAPDYTDLDTCSAALASVDQAPSAPMPDTLRLVSWNVMKYRREGVETILERLAEHTDFLALQEGLRSTITSAPGLAHRYFADGYERAGEQSGVELRTSVEASVTCSLRFREPWLRTPKAVLAAHFPLGEESLLLVTLHAINFTFWITDLREQFAAVGELLEAHAGPAIVVGDFNNWNGYRQAVIESFAKRHGMEVVKFEPDWRSRHLGVPVDGLLQRGFETLTAAAIPTIASDHHPILALLKPLAGRGPGAGNRAAGGEPAPAP